MIVESFAYWIAMQINCIDTVGKASAKACVTLKFAFSTCISWIMGTLVNQYNSLLSTFWAEDLSFQSNLKLKKQIKKNWIHSEQLKSVKGDNFNSDNILTKKTGECILEPHTMVKRIYNWFEYQWYLPRGKHRERTTVAAHQGALQQELAWKAEELSPGEILWNIHSEKKGDYKEDDYCSHDHILSLKHTERAPPSTI